MCRRRAELTTTSCRSRREIEDVKASSYHRLRPETQSVGANVVYNNANAFVIVVSVDIVDFTTPVSAAAAAVVVGTSVDVAVSVSIVDDATAIAAAVAAVGAAVAIDVVILVRSPLRTHRRLCVDVARRRSAVGDLEAHRVRSDAGGV